MSLAEIAMNFITKECMKAKRAHEMTIVILLIQAQVGRKYII